MKFWDTGQTACFIASPDTPLSIGAGPTEFEKVLEIESIFRGRIDYQRGYQKTNRVDFDFGARLWLIQQCDGLKTGFVGKPIHESYDLTTVAQLQLF